jgi:hypothetical protein
MPDDQEPYVYDKKDPNRSHIMPMAMSATGSMMWQVIDHRNERSFWVERRSVSNRILERWASRSDL